MACVNSSRNCTNMSASNVTSEATSGDIWHDNKSIQMGFSIVMTGVSILIVLGNSLVIVSIIKFKYLHTVTNVFIASLATSDTILATGLMLIKLMDLLIPRRNWKYLFCISRSLYNVALPVSFLALVFIGIDRNLAVSRPLKYKTLMTKPRAVVAVVFLWVFLILCTCPVIWYYGLPVDHTTTKITIIRLLPPLVILFFSIMIFTGFFTNILLYLHIVYKLWEHNKSRQQVHPTGTHNPGQINRRTKRVTNMMITVILVLAICWVPYLCTLVSNMVSKAPPKLWMSIVYEVAFCIANSNSLINPIIYWTKNSDFKRAFSSLLGMKPVPVNESSLVSTMN